MGEYGHYDQYISYNIIHVYIKAGVLSYGEDDHANARAYENILVPWSKKRKRDEEEDNQDDKWETESEKEERCLRAIWDAYDGTDNDRALWAEHPLVAGRVMWEQGQPN